MGARSPTVDGLDEPPGPGRRPGWPRPRSIGTGWSRSTKPPKPGPPRHRAGTKRLSPSLGRRRHGRRTPATGPTRSRPRTRPRRSARTTGDRCRTFGLDRGRPDREAAVGLSRRSRTFQAGTFPVPGRRILIFGIEMDAVGPGVPLLAPGHPLAQCPGCRTNSLDPLYGTRPFGHRRRVKRWRTASSAG